MHGSMNIKFIYLVLIICRLKHSNAHSNIQMSITIQNNLLINKQINGVESVHFLSHKNLYKKMEVSLLVQTVWSVIQTNGKMWKY